MLGVALPASPTLPQHLHWRETPARQRKPLSLDVPVNIGKIFGFEFHFEYPEISVRLEAELWCEVACRGDAVEAI